MPRKPLPDKANSGRRIPDGQRLDTRACVPLVSRLNTNHGKCPAKSGHLLNRTARLGKG